MRSHRGLTWHIRIAWTFVGIAVKHAATPLVATVAWVMMGVVVLMLVASAFLKRRSG